MRNAKTLTLFGLFAITASMFISVDEHPVFALSDKADYCSCCVGICGYRGAVCFCDPLSLWQHQLPYMRGPENRHTLLGEGF